MFRWYRQATVCYAYMADVEIVAQLAESRWFTRGWTLQELIAPTDMQFYSSAWNHLGAKSDLEMMEILHQATGIEHVVLQSGIYTSVCVARRMAWAAQRETTRIEDRAYALMGLFDVNMPLMYGEGTKAFLRLQQEILRNSEDLSLLCWGIGDKLLDADIAPYPGGFDLVAGPGPFAKDPSRFATPLLIHQALETAFGNDSPPLIRASEGITMTGALCQLPKGTYLVLPYTTLEYPNALIAVPLVKHKIEDYFFRAGPPVRMYLDESLAAKMMRTVHFRRAPLIPTLSPKEMPQFRFGRTVNESCSSALVLDVVYAAPDVVYNSAERSFSYREGMSGVVGTLIFSPPPSYDVIQSKTRLPCPIKLSPVAILFGVSGRTPWFAVIRILPPDLQDDSPIPEGGVQNTMTRGQVQLCVQNGRPPLRGGKAPIDRLYFGFGSDEFRDYCLAKTEHRPGTRLRKEEMEILMSVQLKTCLLDYVNRGHLLSIDIAGRQRVLDAKPPHRVFHTKGGLEGRIQKPDWQTFARQGEFRPLLSELVPNPEPGRNQKAWCREANCLVCHFGSPEGHIGFP